MAIYRGAYVSKKKPKDSKKKRDLRESWNELQKKWAGESVSGKKSSASSGTTTGKPVRPLGRTGMESGRLSSTVSTAPSFVERLSTRDPKDDSGTKPTDKTYTGQGAIVPLHKGGYTVIMDPEDLKGLGKNPK